MISFKLTQTALLHLCLILPNLVIRGKNDPDLEIDAETKRQGMECRWSGAMFRAQVLPMASDVLPMGNSTLTSIAVERTTAAYVVYSCASAHREKFVRCDVLL